LREGGKGKEQGLGKFHTFLGKLLAASCIMVFVVAVFSVGRVFVVAGPLSSGDWIITGIESYSDQTIVLNGNLIVENGGNLTFRRVTLKLNCTYGGQYGITVGGKFYVLEGSIITSVDSAKGYLFSVGGSTFRMSHSELHYCGWGSSWGTSGIHIMSDDAVVEYSLISHNIEGISVASSGVVVRNNNITANEGSGIVVGREGINPIIYNNYISWNKESGISVGGGAIPAIYNNTITSNQDGISSYSYSNPVILNNTISANLGIGVYCFDHSSGMIQSNTITANQINGIHCEVSNPTIQYNNISQNNGCGICTVGACSPIISTNVITSNGWAGINPHSGSSPMIEGNIIMKNRVGIFCVPNASGTISGNTIMENLDGGIRCHGSSNPTIQGNNITANKGIGIGCDNSNPTIQRNNITCHFPAPDLGWGAGILCYNNSAGTIKENSITHNSNGITCCEHSNPSIDGNSLRNNSNVGVACLNNSSPTIRGNNITDNGGGISLEHSNAIVRENVITSSNGTGIYGGWCSPIIQGNSITLNKEYGVVFKPNCTGIIQGNIIENNLGDGIHLGDGCDTLIKENKITSNNRSGIVIGGYSSPTVERNSIEANGVGIQVDSYSTPTIQANMIKANGPGVSFVKWSNGTLQGNRITSNEVGIFLYHFCCPIIQGNIIDHNTGDGVHCEDKSNPEIHNNDIYSNGGYGVQNNDPSITINATKNYWGSASGPVQLPPDTTDPEEVSQYVLYDPWLTEFILIVEITNPLSDETVSATVTVSANVRAINGVHRVEFYIDELRYTDFDSPYEWSWDTTQYAETSHTIWVLVFDVFGLENKVSRTVFVDNTSPTVLVKEPQSGITYYGMVTISVNATDNREVSDVRVKVDNGAWLIMVYNPTNSFWEYNFNTTTLSDAQHNVMVLALDKAGNPATTSISILTDNAPPTLTIQHPQSGITVGLTLTVTTQASDISGVSRVEFYLGQVLVSTVNFAPYQWAWDTTKYPNGEYTITVKAYDTIGNVKSRDITVTVNNVEVPWLQANLLTIIQVVIGIGGLALAVVTYWSRTREKRKKKKIEKKKEKANVSPQKDSGKED